MRGLIEISIFLLPVRRFNNTLCFESSKKEKQHVRVSRYFASVLVSQPSVVPIGEEGRFHEGRFVFAMLDAC